AGYEPRGWGYVAASVLVFPMLSLCSLICRAFLFACYLLVSLGVLQMVDAAPQGSLDEEVDSYIGGYGLQFNLLHSY
ncbi:hypothetical protein Dimus_013989, partial [Dionaea muscipula]